MGEAAFVYDAFLGHKLPENRDFIGEKDYLLGFGGFDYFLIFCYYYNIKSFLPNKYEGQRNKF